MKQNTIFFFILFISINSFSQNNNLRYQDKKVLAKDMIDALIHTNISKLKSISNALVIAYKDYQKAISPTYKEDSTKTIFDFPENEVYPTSWYIKDSLLYENYIADFYFGELIRSVLNDPDNYSKFGKNIYIAFDKNDEFITTDINKNYIGIMYETQDHIKVVNMEALITYKNTLYSMRQANYHTYSKQKLPSYLQTKMPENIAVYKLEKDNFVPYNNDTILFENTNYTYTDFSSNESEVFEKRDNAPIVKITTITKNGDDVNTNNKEQDIFESVNEMPSFTNGTKGLTKYLNENLRYPKEARKKKLEGKVFIKFIVEKNGKVSHPIIVKDGVGSGCADEALRLVSKMPKWWPGKQNGKAVRVYYTLPITFKL